MLWRPDEHEELTSSRWDEQQDRDALEGGTERRGSSQRWVTSSPSHCARRFAMHAIEQVSRQREDVGQGRYTLLTGDVGVALYLRACIEVDPAFPMIDTFQPRR